MKRFRSVTPLVPLACAALIGCGPNPDTVAGPQRGPSRELIDPAERVGASQVNAHVYGSFVVTVPGGTQPIVSGPANFPGGPPSGPGTCEDGLWINAQGRRTAGSVSSPHPHCVTIGTAMQIVLEPISACYTEYRMITACPVPQEEKSVRQAVLWVADWNRARGVIHGYWNLETGTEYTEASGLIYAFAINAATRRRVGIISFDLSELTSPTTNYIDFDAVGGCALDAAIQAPCIQRLVSADYRPLPAPDGAGTAGPSTGFLWITPASAPYNY